MNGYKIVLLKAIFMLYRLPESERGCSGICKHLLIVPYGIETCDIRRHQTGRHLLIVPYGIETDKWNSNRVRQDLLIVPYGIETRNSAFELILECLLIVP